MRGLRFVLVCGSVFVFSVAAFAQSPHLRLASLQTGSKAEMNAYPDEMEPRLDLKAGVKALPQADRSRRSDPLVELRPTLDTDPDSFYSQVSGADR